MSNNNEIDPYQEYEDDIYNIKDLEPREVVPLIASDPLLEKMVIAFRTLPLSLHDYVCPNGADVETTWRALWGSVTYDIHDMQERIGGSIRDLKKGMQQLKSNRIIYPDGSINEHVSLYLNHQVTRAFDGKKLNLGKK